MLHSTQLVLGATLAVTATAVCAVALVGWLRPPISRLWLDRAALLGVGVAVLAVLAGGLAVATGSWPADPLHFLYAVVAVLTLPIARAWGEAPRPGPMLVGGLVLLGVILRLFQTA